MFWLTTGRKEGIQTSHGMNCQGHVILVLVAGIPKFRYRSINLNLIVLLVRAQGLTQVVTHVGPMAFHSSFDDDQHSCSYVY